MAVDDKHPDYETFCNDWSKCRDASAGQRAVHAAKQTYLPKLEGQTDSEYKAYRERALFYEATGRTVEGLTGMIFRKPPTIEAGGMQDFIEDVTLDGTNLAGFAQDMTKDVIEVGRSGILVDHPVVQIEGTVTQARVEAMNVRPFFKRYDAESIFNWRVERVNNVTALVEVRLHETVEEDGEDEFEVVKHEQIRVLQLFEGKYQQRVFRKSKNADKKDEWVEITENPIVPLMNGKALDYIPFVFVNTDSTSPKVQDAPLIGLVNVNISHYKTTADLEHGAHFTGLPTAVITGHTKGDDESFRIGSTTAWVFSQSDADAKYLEFEGKGLETLQELLKEKEEKMAALGAQMLTPSARRNEAAETAEIRHMGENSVLSSISQTLSEALNTALEYAAAWINSGTTPATIKLNTDFMPAFITPQMMRELLQAVQSGRISPRTYFENMKRGEIIDSEKTYEQEQSEIETEPFVEGNPSI